MLLITKLFCISAVADGIIIIEDFLSANDKGKKKVKNEEGKNGGKEEKKSHMQLHCQHFLHQFDCQPGLVPGQMASVLRKVQD